LSLVKMTSVLSASFSRSSVVSNSPTDQSSSCTKSPYLPAWLVPANFALGVNGVWMLFGA